MASFLALLFSLPPAFLRGHFSPDDNISCFPETGNGLIFLPNKRNSSPIWVTAASPSPKLAGSIIYDPTDWAGMAALGPQRWGSAGGLRSGGLGTIYPGCLEVTAVSGTVFSLLPLSPEAWCIVSNRTLCFRVFLPGMAALSFCLLGSS